MSAESGITYEELRNILRFLKSQPPGPDGLGDVVMMTGSNETRYAFRSRLVARQLDELLSMADSSCGHRGLTLDIHVGEQTLRFQDGRLTTALVEKSL